MSNVVQTGLGSAGRYPVKSMIGEKLNASDVTERGPLGDRAYALVDASDGKGARQMLRKLLADKIELEPVGHGRERGYKFRGALTVDRLIAEDTLAKPEINNTSDGGGPNGIRPMSPHFPSESSGRPPSPPRKTLVVAGEDLSTPRS